MVWLAILLTVIAVALTWIHRFYLLSFYTYLSAQFERRGKDLQLLSSLRENLVHERKKKIAGLEMILSSWEKGEEIQPRYEYFCDLLEQLKGLVRDERAKLMAITRDIWLWGKLWVMLLKIERISRDKREKSDVTALRGILVRFNELTDQVVQSATQRFSFSLNDAVRESVKTVRVEKTQASGISIEESLDDAGEDIRFSYDNFKQWQRLLTNLIRNAFEAVEAKQAGAGPVVADVGLPGGKEISWVKITTKPSEAVVGQARMPDPPGISVIIEDSGIGMDEPVRASFFRKGFTAGKDGGLGLGVTEESVQLIEQYGGWEIESEKGVGTRITIRIDKEKAREAELLAPEEKHFSRAKLALVLSVPVVIVIGLLLFFVLHKHSRFWVDWNPAYAKVEQGRQVAVFNSDGEELWRYEFQQNVSSTEDELGNKSPLIEIEDLDEDGWNETLVAIAPGVEVPGKVFCFDVEGNVKWVFLPGKSIDDGSFVQRRNSRPEVFEVRNLLVDDLVDNTKKEVLVTSVLHAFYPCQLALLNHHGNVTGEYWHPGVIPFSVYRDLDGDGPKELLCAGINNKLNCRAVIFTLDMRGFVGKVQGPPYNIFDDLDPAKEKKYVVLPHIKDVTWNWVEASVFATPRHMDIRADHIFLMLPDGRHYSLTKNLEYVSCEHRIASFTDWQEIIKFPYELNLESDSLSWDNLEIWENGVRIE